MLGQFDERFGCLYRPGLCQISEDNDGRPWPNYIRNFVGPLFHYSERVNKRDGRYQAGEGIYHLFDKVLVLDQGRQVFYGAPGEARGYFEGLGFNPLPRQSTADYLTGCTDPNERQFSPGRSAKDVPSTPEELESAFQRSVYAFDNRESLERYKVLMQTERSDQEAFRAAVSADKKRGVSKKSSYTLGFSGQVRAIALRQFQMRLQDKFQLYTSYTLSLALAALFGGAFYNQPFTSAGAFTRSRCVPEVVRLLTYALIWSSIIFFALLTASMDALAEMPLQIFGRPILRKQVS